MNNADKDFESKKSTRFLKELSNKEYRYGGSFTFPWWIYPIGMLFLSAVVVITFYLAS